MTTHTFTDPRSFSVALETAGREIPASLLSQIQRKILLTGLAGVIQKTPVDTGRAKGNWQVTQDAPAASTVETLDKSGASTINRGASKIRTLPPYCRAYITNNLRYIEVLEYGLYSTGGGYTAGFTPQEKTRTQNFTRKRIAAKELGSLKRLGVDPSKFVRHRTVKLRNPVVHRPKVTAQGFSKQAPAGMVRITFEEMRLAIQALLASGLKPVATGALSNG